MSNEHSLRAWLDEVHHATLMGGYAAGDGPPVPMEEAEWALDEIDRLRRQLFLSANVVNAVRVLVTVGYDRRSNDYKAAFGKVERALLVYDDLIALPDGPKEQP